MKSFARSQLTISLSYRLLEPQIGAAFVCSFEVQLFLAHIQLTGSCDARSIETTFV